MGWERDHLKYLRLSVFILCRRYTFNPSGSFVVWMTPSVWDSTGGYSVWYIFGEEKSCPSWTLIYSDGSNLSLSLIRSFSRSLSRILVEVDLSLSLSERGLGTSSFERVTLGGYLSRTSVPGHPRRATLGPASVLAGSSSWLFDLTRLLNVLESSAKKGSGRSTLV